MPDESTTTTSKKTRKKAVAKRGESMTVKPSGKKRGVAPEKKTRVLELVKKHPTWSAQEIAIAAKCSLNYVHLVWGKPKRARKKRKRGSASSSVGTGNDAEFFSVVKRIGVSRAKELIANIEAYENA